MTSAVRKASPMAPNQPFWFSKSSTISRALVVLSLVVTSEAMAHRTHGKINRIYRNPLLNQHNFLYDRWTDNQRKFHHRVLPEDDQAAKQDELDAASGSLRAVGLRTLPLPVPDRRSLEQNFPNALYSDEFEGRSSLDLKRSEPNFTFVLSPLSNQVIKLDKNELAPGDLRGKVAYVIDLSANKISSILKNISKVVSLSSNEVDTRHKWTSNADCKTMSSEWLLSKDDFDKQTGIAFRNCRGSVQVNRCEGSCGSTVQPSVKMPTGLQKECYCCNEGFFKRLHVRLNECYWLPSKRRISLASGDDLQMSYMDVEVDEPSDCKCRQCDSSA